jgi:hypothetical protein
MTLAETIRRFARDKYVKPGIAAGHKEVVIRAGDVHNAMGLVSRMPAVCGALRSRAFQEPNGLRLIQVEGPEQGANTTFHFRADGAAAASATPISKSFVARPSPLRPRVPAGSGAIFLVSCVSQKRSRPSKARDLYQSEWFQRARRFVESTGSRWFILSAEHGMIDPDRVIEPYERTLNNMRVGERREWAQRVRKQMDRDLPDAERIVVLAGQRYREFLMDYLRTRATRVDVPLEGLRIGEQLSWLGKAEGHASPE